MSQEFYGPWRVSVTEVALHFSQRLQIRGATSGDVDRELGNGVPLDELIEGESWRLDVLMPPFPPVAGEPWHSRKFKVFTELTAAGKWTTTLESTDLPKVKLICESLDPMLSPGRAQLPDFSVPHDV